MKTLIAGCAALLPLGAAGQLLVTEINSNAAPADFWELTNFGNAAVDLGGYVWKDSTEINPVTIPAGTTIGANESVLFVVSTDAAAFRTAWGLSASVKVVAVAADPGLGKDDAVRLFNASGTQVAGLSYVAGGFTLSSGAVSGGGHAGISAGGSATTQSLVLDPNYPVASPRYTFATGGNFSSWPVSGGAGSPGVIGEAASNSAPYFTGSHEVFAIAGTDLASSVFRIRAADSDTGQTVAYSLVSGPAWLTISSDGTGGAMLAGTPPAGSHDPVDFTVRATDNYTTAAATDRVYRLYPMPASSPVVLNEYNAVDAAKYLGDALAPSGTDTEFGQVLGNGGDWFELVVTGSGVAGSLDMRGWKIEISQTVADVTTVSSVIELSQAAYWSAVPNGTILTFIEKNTAQGGLDTSINRRNRLATAGDCWSNIWIGDSYFLTYTDAATNGYTLTSGEVGGIAIDENSTRITLKSASGAVVAGPFGEGVAVGVDVNGTEVFSLNADPSPAVSPLAALDPAVPALGYKDKSNKSSFGWPNEWAGPTVQSFSAYIRPLTAYETWASGLGLADPAAGADVDGDGRTNFREYAFGGDPELADAAPAVSIAISGTTVTLAYARRSNDPSLVFAIWRSTDLLSWQAFTPVSESVQAHATLADFVTATATTAVGAGGSREFFRISVQ